MTDTDTPTELSDERLFALLAEVKELAGEELNLIKRLGAVRTELYRLVDEIVESGRMSRAGIDMFCGKEIKKMRGGARVRTTARVTPDSSEVMSSADMARLADVTRSTVSNWRKRFPADFPSPVDDAVPERYLRADVIKFLALRGYTAAEPE